MSTSNGFHGGNNNDVPFHCVVCNSVVNGAQAYIVHLQHHIDSGEMQHSSNVQQPDIPVQCVTCYSLVPNAEGYYIHYLHPHMVVLGFPPTFHTIPIRCRTCNAVLIGVNAYATHFREHSVLGEMQQDPHQNGEALDLNGLPNINLGNQNMVVVEDHTEGDYASSTESASSGDRNDYFDDSDDDDDGSVAIGPVENGFINGF